MRRAGRVALITGASSGIGRASALRFAREGARVARRRVLSRSRRRDRGSGWNSVVPAYRCPASRPDPQAALLEYGAAQPMKRLGTAEECADVALWLVSDDASFVTGVALPVDGGFTAM